MTVYPGKHSVHLGPALIENIMKICDSAFTQSIDVSSKPELCGANCMYATH